MFALHVTERQNPWHPYSARSAAKIDRVTHPRWWVGMIWTLKSQETHPRIKDKWKGSAKQTQTRAFGSIFKEWFNLGSQAAIPKLRWLFARSLLNCRAGKLSTRTHKPSGSHASTCSTGSTHPSLHAKSFIVDPWNRPARKRPECPKQTPCESVGRWESMDFEGNKFKQWWMDDDDDSKVDSCCDIWLRWGKSNPSLLLRIARQRHHQESLSGWRLQLFAHRWDHSALAGCMCSPSPSVEEIPFGDKSWSMGLWPSTDQTKILFDLFATHWKSGSCRDTEASSHFPRSRHWAVALLLHLFADGSVICICSVSDVLVVSWDLISFNQAWNQWIKRLKQTGNQTV